MKTIPLTKGKFAIVDDEDYEELSKYKWKVRLIRKHFYAFRGITDRWICMHREIMGLPLRDNRVVDHINNDGIDNRRCNLRICTHQQNCFNKKIQVGRNSQYKGVRKDRNRWKASIKHNYKEIHIGSFGSEIDAAKAYDNKAKELFGEFSCLNFKGKENG
jgi:hypothetical protein